jgi:hypothetical protein
MGAVTIAPGPMPTAMCEDRGCSVATIPVKLALERTSGSPVKPIARPATRSRRWRLRAIGIALFAASCSSIVPIDPNYRDHYVGGRSQAPYIGRVIDAETGQPLEGAVVVGKWERERVALFHGTIVRYKARDVLTGRNGEFVLDARTLENWAPRGTLRPIFTIFLPGYAASGTSHFFKKKGFVDGEFGKGPVTVGLPRLKVREERYEHVGYISPYCLSDKPFKEIPEFTRLFNEERVAVGLGPYPPPGKRP